MRASWLVVLSLSRPFCLKNFVTFYFLFIFIYFVCVCVCTIVHVWRSEDNSGSWLLLIFM